MRGQTTGKYLGLPFM